VSAPKQNSIILSIKSTVRELDSNTGVINKKKAGGKQKEACSNPAHEKPDSFEKVNQERGHRHKSTYPEKERGWENKRGHQLQRKTSGNSRVITNSERKNAPNEGKLNAPIRGGNEEKVSHLCPKTRRNTEVRLFRLRYEEDKVGILRNKNRDLLKKKGLAGEDPVDY